MEIAPETIADFVRAVVADGMEAYFAAGVSRQEVETPEGKYVPNSVWDSSGSTVTIDLIKVDGRGQSIEGTEIVFEIAIEQVTS